MKDIDRYAFDIGEAYVRCQRSARPEGWSSIGLVPLYDGGYEAYTFSPETEFLQLSFESRDGPLAALLGLAHMLESRVEQREALLGAGL